MASQNSAPYSVLPCPNHLVVVEVNNFHVLCCGNPTLGEASDDNEREMKSQDVHKRTSHDAVAIDVEIAQEQWRHEEKEQWHV